MFGSTYQSLVNEEKTLPKPDRSRKYEMEEFMEKIVKPRAAFATKIETAYKNGKITKAQYDELIELNRRHSLNM